MPTLNFNEILCQTNREFQVEVIILFFYLFIFYGHRLRVSMYNFNRIGGSLEMQGMTNQIHTVYQQLQPPRLWKSS